MKALTLTQPWATLVATGKKRIETRSWRTGYRGPLAIHAAKGFPAAARRFAEHEHTLGRLPSPIPFGAVLCIVRLTDCQPAEEAIFDISALERLYGDYTYGAGRWAWFLDDVKVFATPIPARGALGLWNWKEATP